LNPTLAAYAAEEHRLSAEETAEMLEGIAVPDSGQLEGVTVRRYLGLELESGGLRLLASESPVYNDRRAARRARRFCESRGHDLVAAFDTESVYGSSFFVVDRHGDLDVKRPLGGWKRDVFTSITCADRRKPRTASQAYKAGWPFWASSAAETPVQVIPAY
jgi:hypothetical protein